MEKVKNIIGIFCLIIYSIVITLVLMSITNMIDRKHQEITIKLNAISEQINILQYQQDTLKTTIDSIIIPKPDERTEIVIGHVTRLRQDVDELDGKITFWDSWLDKYTKK